MTALFYCAAPLNRTTPVRGIKRLCLNGASDGPGRAAAQHGAGFARLGAGNGKGARVMIGEKVFDDISARLAAAMAASPVRDVEKNVRALLRGARARLDLVSREEFDIQVALLARTREKLDALEERLASLEAGAKTAAKRLAATP